MGGKRGTNPDNRGITGDGVHDHRPLCARGIQHLVGAHGHENLTDMPARELECSIPLRLALILEGRLVALHTGARTAREDETIDRVDAHGTTPQALLPPSLDSKRTPPITMSCD